MKHGIINVYKEAGMTSFQVVSQIRKITGEKKIGHTGTLDPEATGVLPVCIGKATKLVDYLMDTEKQYRARLLFGKKTDTQDLSGKVLEHMENEFVHQSLCGTGENSALSGSAETGTGRIKEAFDRFTGEIRQLPPMYSAVKVDGVKLVDAARRGRDIERRRRSVMIYGYCDLRISGLEQEKAPVRVDFTVTCSKGTYIRTLCEDIGGDLGIPACLERLERIRTGGLDLSGARTLKELMQAGQEGRLEELIIPTDAFLVKYPALQVKDQAVRKLIYGNCLTEDELEAGPAGQTPSVSEEPKPRYRVYDGAGTFYAVYYFDKKSRRYKCEKMFMQEPEATCR